MPYSIRKKSPKCWTVINTETGAVKAKCTSKTNAEAQRRLLYGVEHGWSVSDSRSLQRQVKPTQGGYLESFKRKPGLLPPYVRKLLDKIGDEKITSLKIVRTPLSTFVSSLLNVISLGAYQKAVNESPYDSMFHLAMLINGKYVVEKNEVIKLYLGNPVKEKSETFDLSVSKSVSIKDLFENGRKKMGDMNFTNYDARSNNCQDFLLGLLSGSDLLTENARQFIKQDPEVVFKKMPSISEKIGRFITDLGAVGERAMEGEGFRETWVIHGGRLMPILVGGAIPEDIMEEARRKYYLEKAKKIIEQEIPEVDRPQLLPEYERHQIPSLPPKKKYISEKKQMESPPRSERKEKKSKSSSSWREFYASAVKGKKFKNRQEVNSYMRECAKKYKEMKGK